MKYLVQKKNADTRLWKHSIPSKSSIGRYPYFSVNEIKEMVESVVELLKKIYKGNIG